MQRALNRLPKGSKAAVVALRSLAECVLATPAISMLKRHRPDLEIAVVADREYRAVFEGNPDVAAILSPHLPPLWTWRPRLCLNLHGGTRGLILAELSGAEITASFQDARAAWAYSVVIPLPADVFGQSREFHLAERFAAAAFHLGVPLGDVPAASLYAKDAPPARATAVIQPSKPGPSHPWPAANFVEVAQRLQSAGFEVAVIGERGDDLKPFASFQALSGRPLPEVMTLIRHAALFIGHVGGMSQVAAAFGVPQVALCEAEGPRGRAPWKALAPVLVADGTLASIEVSQVMAAVDHLEVRA